MVLSLGCLYSSQVRADSPRWRGRRYGMTTLSFPACSGAEASCQTCTRGLEGDQTGTQHAAAHCEGCEHDIARDTRDLLSHSWQHRGGRGCRRRLRIDVWLDDWRTLTGSGRGRVAGKQSSPLEIGYVVLRRCRGGMGRRGRRQYWFHHLRCELRSDAGGGSERASPSRRRLAPRPPASVRSLPCEQARVLDP
jgi:hypothetical protein